MRILVISGGSSGIGLATAKKAVDQFDHVISLDIQVPEYSHDKFYHIHCDVSDYENLDAVVKQLHADFGVVTHLFLCAGVLESNRLENSTAERIPEVININLVGAILLLKAVLPMMQQHKQGNIVITGSDQALVGKAGNSVYGCTKAALVQLTKSMAIENADNNIRVNCLCPGTIDTPFYQQASARYAAKNQLDVDVVRTELAKEQPMGRIGTPEEVAELAIFLLSDQAGYMTGSIIAIDGGFTAQ